MCLCAPHLTERPVLMCKDCGKLAVCNAIPIVQQRLRLVATVAAVKLQQHLLDHLGHAVNHLLAVALHKGMRGGGGGGAPTWVDGK